jgi:hypothetical protein
MVAVTGLSLGSIERGTRAVGNSASRRNRQETAARTARARKGEKKPWLTAQLKAAWDSGKYDFHHGRIRSVQVRETMWLAAQRPDVKQRRSQAALRRWQDPEERVRLLAYHQSEETRILRSKNTTKWMAENPHRCLRGIGAWVEPRKCTRPRIWTRSSYERVVVGLLDHDPDVISYTFEPRIELDNGRWILPDFVVIHKDGRITLVEVKASWVLALPTDSREQRRLSVASSFAATMGWEFLVWTEKDFANARHDTTDQATHSLSNGQTSREVNLAPG